MPHSVFLKSCLVNQINDQNLSDNAEYSDFRIIESPRETKIGSRNRGVRERGGKPVVLD